MVFQPTKSLLVAALAAIALTHVAAHGSIISPTVVFLDPSNRNAPSAMAAGPAGPYTGNAVLKDLAESKGSKCGKTDGNAAVQPIPADGIVKLAITAAHIGPCEFWLDNEKVASAKNCVSEYPDRKIKVDFSKCKSGKCQLRWVWLATHNSPWEIYDNCVNVGAGDKNNDGAVTPSASPSLAPTSAPTVAPTSAPTVSPTNGPSPQPPNTTTKTPSPSKSLSPMPLPTATVAPDSDVPGTVGPAPTDGGAKFRGIDNSAALNWWCTINCERGFCPESTCVKL